MKAEPVSIRERMFVPPEQVMTRLMRREDERRGYWVELVVLLAGAASFLLGVALAIRY
ncbi:MAG: hypothetical protein QN152_13155 [Armatimonadota bacterium]|nr:hypothetical protein [Armatimonadota bacterium]MDR7464977.1 hypothetical protein [Armatimonadota bacterium]MDR7470633.1 hypothetical protein [Armatimonadota bacterium]MDR7474218.1 hypothetical protein [Armatimonadota bacterium]MDR7540454.1 hypothetical protein [Armatimonadota bacterium]